MTGIKPAPRGQPQIEVSFKVDVNGVLKVTAEDKGTGEKNDITIERSGSGLTPEEIEKMIKDAEESAEEDQKFKELVEARNGLEALAYTAKSQVEDLEKKGHDLGASEGDIEKVKDLVSETIDWIDSNGSSASLEELQEKKSELEAVLHPLAQAMYANSDNNSHTHDEQEL